jgi:hypothetical protein
MMCEVGYENLGSRRLRNDPQFHGETEDINGDPVLIACNTAEIRIRNLPGTYVKYYRYSILLGIQCVFILEVTNTNFHNKV